MKPRILGGIFAGGRSSRFGAPKDMALWQGRTLIDHVIMRMAPQCTQLVILGGSPRAPWPLLADDGTQGPGAAVLSGLSHAHAVDAAYLLTAPCDAPLLPVDLGEQLMSAIGTSAVAMLSADGVHPAFSLWRAETLKNVRAAWRHGTRSLLALAQAAGPVAAAPVAPLVVSNINRPADLAHIRQVLRR